MCALVLVAGPGGAAGAQAPAADAPAPLPLVPRPQTAERGDGHLTVTPATRIVAERPALLPVARQLAADVREAAGFAPRAAAAGAGGAGSEGGAPAIRLALDTTLGAEAYRLRVGPSGARITGGSPAGVFYGAQTLRQLLPVRGDSAGRASVRRVAAAAVRLPTVRVEDAPRFAWRGMHLDVSRHFFSKEYLKRFVDYLALYKFNRFHLHLTDDQGWRLEIKRYPKLTEEGAWRALNGQDSTVLRLGEQNPDFLHLPAEHVRGAGAARRYGGYYTQDDIREVVAYAAARHVMVVPEIDMPGHMMAAIASYPELSCTGSASWGTTFSVPLCPGKEEVYTFVGHVLDEVAALFPGPYVHVGGDEVEKTTWKAHAGSQALMAREGLKDVDELQSYFIRRVGRMVAARGKRMIGWDEIIEGGLAPGATVMFWRSWVPEAPVAAARQGHDVIMAPANCCYFSEAETAESLRFVYGFEPVPAALAPDEARHVLGPQGALWAEYIPTPAQVEYMAFPRMLALAEVAWTRPPARDWPDFQRRLAAHYPRLDAMGVHYRVPPVPGLHPRTVVLADTTVTLAPPVPGVALRYTTDGSLPTRASRPGTAPLRVTGDVTVRVRPFYPDGLGGAAQTIRIERQTPRPADAPGALQPGLNAAYYPVGVVSVDSVRGEPASTTVVPNVAVPAGARAPAFALVYAGYVRVPADGVYTFTLVSDDGSTLDVGGRRVVDNDGPHSRRALTGQVALRAGLHPVRLRFFEGGGGHTLELHWAGPGVSAGPVPATALFH